MGGSDPWRLHQLWAWEMSQRVEPSLMCSVVPAVAEQVELQTLQFRSGRVQL